MAILAKCRQRESLASALLTRLYKNEAEGTRTLNLRIDSPMLYPIELRPRNLNYEPQYTSQRTFMSTFFTRNHSYKKFTKQTPYYIRFKSIAGTGHQISTYRHKYKQRQRKKPGVGFILRDMHSHLTNSIRKITAKQQLHPDF